MEPSFLIEADATEDKGARHTMEDASVMLLDFVAKAARQTILNGFLKTDKSILQESAEGGWQDGATAVFVWVLGQRINIIGSIIMGILLNNLLMNSALGDAKAVLARSTNGSQNHPDGVQTQLKAIVLTREHKSIFQLERARIEKV
ncbi:hypothetical protein JHK82_018032 [Glycine max]|nr:hypothetical protein JHK82_018032 [Glycine max]